MYKRREFFASIAAGCAAIAVPKLAFASTPDRSLNWRSTTIQTIAQTEGNRAPVVTAVAFRPRSNELAIVGDDHFIGIFNRNANQFVQHLREHDDWVRAARFSPTGELLATAGNDRRILIWDTNNYQTPSRIALHPEAVIDIAFSPDGSQLASVGFERSLRIYDVASRQVVRELECACDDNHTVAFSKDGEWIASAGRCGTVSVWSVATGVLEARYAGHRNRVRSLEFDDQNQILSCGEDQTFKLTNPSDPATPISEARQSARLFDIKLIGNDMVATGGADNLIHIWRASNAEHVGVLKGHTGTVCCLDANARHLVSGSYDTQVRVWTLESNVANQDRQTRLNKGWNQKLK